MKIFYTFTFILLISLKVAISKAEDERNLRIIQGNPIMITEVPYQVAIMKKDNSQYKYKCGGSLIALDLVLTSARCLTENTGSLTPHSLLRVYAGSTTLDGASTLYSELKWTKIHEKYQVIENKVFYYDIGLAKLQSPFTASNSIAKIDLGTELIGFGEECLISGWGSTTLDSVHSNHLTGLKTPVQTNIVCEIVYQERYNYGLQSDGSICTGLTTGSPGPCRNDFGGPLVCRNKLTGIISHDDGCGQSATLGIYTRVSSYLDWIEQNSGANTLSSAFMVTLLQIILMYIRSN